MPWITTVLVTFSASLAKAGKAELFGYLESVLEQRDWLAGDDFSAADVMMGWVLDVADPLGDLEERPACRRYLEKLRARPAYGRAKERASGGPASR